MDQLLLEKKVALITGASRGIGAEIAKLFAAQGAKVVINYRANKDEADNLANEIKSNGGQSIAIKADLAKLQDIELLFKQLKEQFGTIDILVNNAGVMKPQGPLDLVWGDALETFIIDAIAPMFCAREAMKIMMEQNKSGSIVNITSVRGLDHAGLGGNLAYSAAKAALNNFTGSLAKEWDIKKSKIRVNAVAPGYTNTDLHTWDEATVAKKSAETALGKILHPQEIAEAVLWLASDKSSGVTGEILVVDAGLKLK